MNFLTARRTSEGLDLLYQSSHSQGLAQSQPLSRVARTALGLGYPGDVSGNYGYCCVVAERSWEAREKGLRPAYQYVVIDEGDALGLLDLLTTALRLKDTYLSEVVGVPNQPASAMEAVRGFEGLTHYPDQPAVDLKERWPTYVSKDATAGVYAVAVPGIQVIRQELKLALDGNVGYPDDPGLPVFGAGDEPLKKFSILQSDMGKTSYRTHTASQALSVEDEATLVPLWLAVHTLQNTTRRRMRSPFDRGRKKDVFTGY